MDQWGAMETGWVYVNGHWYYMNQQRSNGNRLGICKRTLVLHEYSGAMATGWVYVNGHWYYMNNSGAMRTGWVNVNGLLVLLDQWGAMTTGLGVGR